MWLAGGRQGRPGDRRDRRARLQRRRSRAHVSDLHATILHLMGLDHERLTYFYQGLDQRLTGVRGEVLHEVCS